MKASNDSSYKWCSYYWFSVLKYNAGNGCCFVLLSTWSSNNNNPSNTSSPLMNGYDTQNISFPARLLIIFASNKNKPPTSIPSSIRLFSFQLNLLFASFILYEINMIIYWKNLYTIQQYFNMCSKYLCIWNWNANIKCQMNILALLICRMYEKSYALLFSCFDFCFFFHLLFC